MGVVEQQRLQEMEQNDAMMVLVVVVGVTMANQERIVLVQYVFESWPQKDQWPRDHPNLILHQHCQTRHQCCCCCFVQPSLAGCRSHCPNGIAAVVDRSSHWLFGLLCYCWMLQHFC